MAILHRAFTSQIYQASCLPLNSPLLKELRKEASQIETADLEGQDWSTTHYPKGYTSYGSWDQLHRMSPNFAELKKKLDPQVKKFIAHLAWDIPAKSVQMTRLWINIMKPGASHGMHLHPLSVISGTFYLQTPAKSSPLKFEDPRFGLFMNRPPLKRAAKFEQQSFPVLKPRAGEVILFESWMRHEVPVQTGEGTRTSVSFNYDWIRD